MVLGAFMTTKPSLMGADVNGLACSLHHPTTYNS
jgi:hypothetical protein